MSPAAQVLDGVAIAAKRLDALSKEIAAQRQRGAVLTLGTLRAGESKDTLLYEGAITKLAQKVNVRHKILSYPEKISQADLRQEIRKAVADPAITGLMLFSPLPAHLDAVALLTAVDVGKDVEGRRILHTPGERVSPPTAAAAMVLIEETGVDLAGKEAVVAGRSDIVGKPVAWLLLEKHATVTVCHSRTKDLKSHIQRADVVVATVGKPELIRGSWIKPGAIVIDVGENVVNGKFVGDVEFAVASRRASWISPVPRGVGPVTNVMLIKNLLTLYKSSPRRRGSS